jgi:putative SOS response-associated peptidase YedK
MCGRFTISKTKEEFVEYLRDNFSISGEKLDFNLPRYNISPGENIVAVINDGDNNKAGLIKWGFVAPFQKDEKTNVMINARAETLSEKVSFKESFKSKRCILLADSYYEWKTIDNKKTPMRILLNDKQFFAMAGLWTKFVRLDGSHIFTCAIVTTKANDTVSNIHHRMPVILTSDKITEWINPKNKDLEALNKLISSSIDIPLEYYQVSTKVNSSRIDDVSLIEQVI